MKINNLAVGSLMFVLLFVLNSCGRFFRETNFKAPENGIIALDNEVVLENGQVEKRHVKYYPIQVTVLKEGCKSHYSVWYANKYNGWADIELFLIPIGTGVVFKILDVSDRPFLAGYLVNAWTVFGGLKDKVNGPLVDRDFDYDLEEYPKLDDFKSHFRVINCSQNNGLIFRDNLDLELRDSTKMWMNDFIDELGVLETEELNITGFSDFNINADLLVVNQAESSMRRQKEKITETSLIIHYQILDKLGEELLDTTIVSQSGQFIGENASNYSFHDALDYNVLYLFKSESVQNLSSKVENVSNSVYYNPKIRDESSQVFSYQKLSNSIYKLETPYGFAPIIPITADGVAAISYHAYNLADSLKVTSPKGDTLRNIEILEKSLLKDYVIVKLNQSTPVHFPIANLLSNGDTLENGIAVQSVGYDIDYDALMIDRWNVFSEHTENKCPVYQIDASSHGMIYPAVFSTEGHLLGFVTRSVKSRNVEGISFFRPIVNIP